MTRPLKLLAIETSAEGCSAALYLDGVISERFDKAPRGHSDLILGMMGELLEEAGLKLADLDALAFGRGPGSFTGVRIAAGVIQGTAFGANLPVVPVSTLAALAQQAFRKTGRKKLLPAFDARMQEVYWAAYEVNPGGLVEPRMDEQVVAPDAVQLPEGDGWLGVGNGWASYDEQLKQRLGDQLDSSIPELLCRAYDIALLGAVSYQAGQWVTAEEALPVYLRDQVANKPKQQSG